MVLLFSVRSTEEFRMNSQVLCATVVNNLMMPVFRARQITGISMDITSIAAIVTTATSNSASQLRAAVEMSVLKQAIDIQAAGALELVQAVSAPVAAAAGEAGGGVDTWA
jgi:uncharacterized protein YaaW (UPF0174 family)